VFWCCVATYGNRVVEVAIPPLLTMGSPSSGRILIIGKVSTKLKPLAIGS